MGLAGLPNGTLTGIMRYTLLFNSKRQLGEQLYIKLELELELEFMLYDHSGEYLKFYPFIVFIDHKKWSVIELRW